MGWRLQRCKATAVRQQLLDIMTQVREVERSKGGGGDAKRRCGKLVISARSGRCGSSCWTS